MILFCSVVLQGQSFKPSEPLWESMGIEILSEHWVINPPQKHHPRLSCQAPLKSANCPSPPF